MNTLSRYKQILLFIMSNLGWFACVYSSPFGLEIFSYAVPLIFFIIIRTAMPFYIKDILKHVLIATVGIAFDFSAIATGFVHLEPASPFMISHWLISLWILFSFSLPIYNQWLHGQWFKIAALGFVFGPLTYKSGEAIGVLYFSSHMIIAFYAVFWALFFPISLKWIGRKT